MGACCDMYLREGAGGGEIKGLFVGAPGGGMYECPEMSIQDGELTFVFER